MNLADRLAAARASGVVPTGRREASGALPPAREALGKLKGRVTQALFARLGSRMTDTALTQEQLHDLVRRELAIIVAAEELPLTGEERSRLSEAVIDDVLGFGPLQRLLDDDIVTEIMVNGPDQVYIERNGRLELSLLRFASEQHLRNIIERIVLRVGRRIDESSPLVDARLPDGSRVNAIIPPLSVDGSTLTIRKFSRDPYQIDDLLRFGTLTPHAATVLDAAVRARLNILVSGGTGSGKTTLLNVLSSFIPDSDRIVTIEDAAELQLQQPHVVRLESRPPNIEGRGEITIRDLVRNALRMRPDRIIVGEVRGGEALDMLQAMNTGHDGSISTLHANAPRDALARLETMVLMSGLDLPLRAVREQVASAIDLIVQIGRLRDGSRRVTSVTEVLGSDNDGIITQDLFTFEHRGADRPGDSSGDRDAVGVIRQTAAQPRFYERLRQYGIPIPVEDTGDPEGA